MQLDKENKMLLGVCAGIAKHFNVDVTIVRIIFVVAAVFWGVALIAYPILWLIMSYNTKY